MRRTVGILAVTLAFLVGPTMARAGAAGGIVGVAPAAAGSWTVDATGQVAGLGGAKSLGSVSGPLARPIVGMAATPTGAGYWLVASDGGIFTFGDARFLGSTGAMRLTRPIVGMASTATGRGYWLVASDGGIFTFGDAVFRGSAGSLRLVAPIVGMAHTKSGAGYWLFGADGGVFTFGDATYLGAANRPVQAVAAAGGGYRIASIDGSVLSFVAGTAPSVDAPPIATTRDAWKWPFASTSPWNMPIGSAAQYEASSAPRTSNLIDPRFTAWVNAGQYSIPIYRASSTDPVATFRRPGHADVSLRVPASARPANGTDAQMAIIDPSGHWADESWLTLGANPSWTTGYLVHTDLYGSGIDAGVRAYGGSALGGLVRQWEIDAGTIRHAIGIALNNDQLAAGPVWPASAQDAGQGYRGRNPMGTLAAIPPSVDVTKLGLSREGLALARAMQDYGAYVTDRSSGFTVYTEPSLEGSPGLAAMRHDLSAIRAQLRVVANSGPGTVGGGGVPRAPLAPLLSP